MTSFEEILNQFKLRNCWLNSKLYATQPNCNAQVVTSLLTSSNNLSQQVDIRMRSQGLRQLVTTSLLQINCQQAGYNLF